MLRIGTRGAGRALTPLQNLVVRTCEEEAYAFGINAAREPYGAAMAAMRVSTYRKLRPGRVEEFLFYDGLVLLPWRWMADYVSNLLP